jgi:hypothetical protein
MTTHFSLFEKLVLLILLKMWFPSYEWDCMAKGEIYKLIDITADPSADVKRWVCEDNKTHHD